MAEGTPYFEVNTYYNPRTRDFGEVEVVNEPRGVSILGLTYTALRGEDPAGLFHDTSLDVAYVSTHELIAIKGGQPELGDEFKIEINALAIRSSELGTIVISYDNK